MSLPTIYFLTVKECPREWAIFEQHRCQEKGCFWTEPQLLGWFETKEEAVECAENWKPLEGIVKDIEVIENEELLQGITEVHSTHVTVMSNKGNAYDVKMSDEVKAMSPKPGDTAILKTHPEGWIVTDIIRKVTQRKSLAEQRKSVMDLMGDY